MIILFVLVNRKLNYRQLDKSLVESKCLNELTFNPLFK
jgi:hypothetical protein